MRAVAGGARGRSRRTAAAALLLAALALATAGPSQPAPADAGSAGEADPALRAQRAARRSAVRAAVAAAREKSAAATLPLLIIPVDFADARLPDGWRSDSLWQDGLASFTDYFRDASAGRAAIGVRLAPLVRLPEARRAYSDRDLQGFTRTRRLAREAIEGACAAGVLLREADGDGPDGLPGSDDDDGEVDGVLILHADAGDENEPDALIQALQYYLDEPVVQRGVIARSYAVASLRSGVGIWAHEAAHLFGLEDRYDPFLAATGGELAGRGGLGRFSLMAAGAFGTGGGAEPALLDAYSAAQLGWCDVVPWRGSGAPATLPYPSAAARTAWRVWTRGEAGDEYFLLEARGGAAAWPWDRDVPAGLLVYHVDESLPERAASSPDPGTRHLRVALIEADGDGALRLGLDAGSAADPFPGAGGVTALTPATAPSSAGYGGATEVSLTGIAALADGVSLLVGDYSVSGAPAFALDFRFTAGAPPRLAVTARETGRPALAVVADVVAASGTEWGSFGGADSVRVTLTRSGTSWTAAVPPVWTPAPALAPGAQTAFRVRLVADSAYASTYRRSWVWSYLEAPLDFAGAWPGTWSVLDRAPERPGTAWQRWAAGTAPTGDGSSLLICTGAGETTSARWPDVAYANGADVALVSAPLDPAVRGVRLVHALDGEWSDSGAGWDGAVVEWLGGDGQWAPGQPVDGYGGRIEASARSGLHGRAAFVGEDSVTAAGPWRWRVDLVPVPPDLPPPVRLGLRFASDDLYRGRGWLVARLEPVRDELPISAFPFAWLADHGEAAGDYLVWDRPWASAGEFLLETSADAGGTWREEYRGIPAAGAGGWPFAAPYRFTPAPVPCPLAAKGAPAFPYVWPDRVQARLALETPLGWIAARTLGFYPDWEDWRQPSLGAPFPNPFVGAVSVPVITGSYPGTLCVYDVRGRELLRRPLGAGEFLVEWDGRDGAGRPVPAGVYLLGIVRLAGGDRSDDARRGVLLASRKVVRLR